MATKAFILFLKTSMLTKTKKNIFSYIQDIIEFRKKTFFGVKQIYQLTFRTLFSLVSVTTAIVLKP